VRIEMGDVPRPFTLIMPYYENPNFLAQQLAHLAALPVDVREVLSIIIVDDGSPESPAEPIIGEFLAYYEQRAQPFESVRLFRIDVDVRWNWLAARNIGAHHADDGWLMITDMDHVLPPGTARALVYGVHSPSTIYRFERREHTGHGLHPHPNSWFYTRDMYWRVGGHDEALSGYYGTDGEYRRRCVKTAPIRIMDCALERHEKIGDSSTTHYKRKQAEDATVKRRIGLRGRKWRPRVLSFPYHEVAL